MSKMLEIHNLTMGYDKGPILSNLSFSIPSKAFVAIFGQNGSGKSTLLKGIAGLLPIISGEILLDGNPVHKLPAWERVARGVTILLQSERIFPEFDVLTNVEIAGYRMKSRTELNQRVKKAFAITDIFEGRYHEPASNLSGGEQQILSLLRSLVMEPKLLLLDEPSAGLAPAMQLLIAGILKNLHDQGINFLLVEQNVEFARSVAKGFYHLQNGKLFEISG